MQRSIYPCQRCLKRTHCSLFTALQQARSPWEADDITREFSKADVAWADSGKKNVLTVRLECREYEEDIDAP